MAAGKTVVLFSGYATSNAYEYRKFSVIGYGMVAVIADDNNTVQSGQTTSTSGITYIIRGYPTETAPAYVKTVKAGTVLNSGDCHYNVFTNPYDQIDVGVKSTQSNRSGLVTVTVTAKRRT